MRPEPEVLPVFDGRPSSRIRFLIVRNMRPRDPGNIVRATSGGAPALADARFFFETDKKSRLESRVPQLASIVHHNKLGTQRERVDRLVMLSQDIQKCLPRGVAGSSGRCGRLSAKADLVTLMVGEFPELQGLMGRYYAEADGEPPSVCRAIEQHYWPRFAGDALPTGDASIAVALADRLDALVGMFSIGQVPTGDKDPVRPSPRGARRRAHPDGDIAAHPCGHRAAARQGRRDPERTEGRPSGAGGASPRVHPRAPLQPDEGTRLYRQ
jgi:glycyl-tRNA synthetase beta chain